MNFYTSIKRVICVKTGSIANIAPILLPLSLLTTGLYASNSAAFELNGSLTSEFTQFQHASVHNHHESSEDNERSERNEHSVSIAAELDFLIHYESSYLQFQPFVRWDQEDDERSHMDIRELSWNGQLNNLYLRLGIKKVFWGVTESQHLVDIINQTDLVENIDGEQKLGQPMINISYASDQFGIFDLFLLTGFRERTFADVNGLSLYTLPISKEVAYQSGSEARHIDYAFRWEHYWNSIEWGISWFKGTARDPLLSPIISNDSATTSPTSALIGLTPFYPQIEQFGIDLQWIAGAWLFKWEAIHHDSKAKATEDHQANTLGFEYTQYTVLDSATDIGWIVEYLLDSRHPEQLFGTRDELFFDRDWFFGMRVIRNDRDSTELLAGITYDFSTDHALLRLEASKRWLEHFTLSLEANIIKDSDREQGVLISRKDSLLLKATRYW